MSEALKTDKGTTRESNQDYVASSKNENGDAIYILCDGMGGYKGGEIASLECAKYIKRCFSTCCFDDADSGKQWLYETIVKANERVRNLASKNDEISNMGTTLACLVVTKKFKLYASVGDSRIYAYNHKELIQISEDQTFANALLKAGYINEKEAQIHPKKNLLLCAIGSVDDDLDIQIDELSGKYNYLLCSDGLYNMVDHKDILKLINSEEDIDARAKSLIDLATSNGGKDNISVILVEDNL